MAQADLRPDVQQLTGTWVIDIAHSNIGFAVKHMMFTTVRGSFTEAEGHFTIADDISQSSAQATIKAASINTNNADRDGHLRSGDFLDVENHPELVFKSTRVEPLGDNRARLHGDLTVRETTRPVTLDVSFNGILPKDLYGVPRASFSVAGKINRKEFGLTWNQALETGGVLVGEDVNFEIEIAAVRKDEG